MPSNWIRPATAVFLALTALSCERDTTGLELAPPNTDPLVFVDNFAAYSTFQAFSGSKLDALSIDPRGGRDGSAALKVTVPGPGETAGTFAGGAFTTGLSRDLSGYDALTFWVRASKATATLNVAGLGNDNTGLSRYEASWSNIPITSGWTKVIIPIPLPDRLQAEQGLFFFAEGYEDNAGYEIWFDDVMFEKTGVITNPRPVLSRFPLTLSAFVGGTVQVEGTQTTFQVGEGAEQRDERIDHFPGYFTYISSDETVVAIDGESIRAVGAGNATLTARLGNIDAQGALIVRVGAAPTVGAPAPTFPAAKVISLFSNAYSNVPVDTWSATWDQATVSDFRVAGDDMKVYTSLVFAGIEFAQHTIDASVMTHFHVDVWAPNATIFKVKLVDFGADGVFDPPGDPNRDDSEHELTFDSGSTPPLVSGTWVRLDIPLADFTNLSNRTHMAQLILSLTGTDRTVFVDNVLFHN